MHFNETNKVSVLNMRQYSEQERVILEKIADQFYLPEVHLKVVKEHPHHLFIDHLLVLLVVLTELPEYFERCVDEFDYAGTQLNPELFIFVMASRLTLSERTDM